MNKKVEFKKSGTKILGFGNETFSVAKSHVHKAMMVEYRFTLSAASLHLSYTTTLLNVGSNDIMFQNTTARPDSWTRM